MNRYFDLTPEQQRTIITQTAIRLGLPEQAVEKDLWVTTILQLVFILPFADKLVFKGGTSLSKSFGLIQRFSEDIDLAVDRSLFDLYGDLTKKQIKTLRKKSSLFVRNDFASLLKEVIASSGLVSYCNIVPEPDGEGDDTYPEPRKIDVYYKSHFPLNEYLQPKVILEIGSRSLFEPTINTSIASLISAQFSQIETSITPSPTVTTAAPEKTFLEKAFLLHELFTTGRATSAERKSRHLYDLERMMDEPFAQQAISDDHLWTTIAHHREVFTSLSGVDYTPDIRDRIVLCPPLHVRSTWAKDYADMQQSMIYGASLPFDALLERMEVLEELFHRR